VVITKAGDPDSSASVPNALKNNSIIEADIVGLGKTFGAGQKPNKTTFANGVIEGGFDFSLDGATAVLVDVFSSAERTKLNRLRAGKIPTSDTVLLENTTDSQGKVDARLSSAEKISLNAGTSPDNTKSFDNAGTITGTIGSGGLSAANVATRVGNISNTGAFSGSLNATQFPMAAMVTGANATAVKTTIALQNVDNTSDATVLSGNLTGTVNNVAVTTVSAGAAAAALGLDSAGAVKQTVPAAYYTNTQLTASQVRGNFSHTGAGSYDSATGVFTGVDTNTHPSAAETRAHFSHSGPGSYNSVTGVFTGVDTNTHPSAAETRAHFSGSGYNQATGAFTDTNTTYSAGDFNITGLSGYTAAAYANSSVITVEVNRGTSHYWTSGDNGATWGASLLQDWIINFVAGGTVSNTVTIRATLNDASDTISFSEISGGTGINALSVTGSGTNICSATVTHTATGSKVTISTTAIIIGYFKNA